MELKKILYIEDDEGSQYVVEMLLDESKYDYHTASNGQEGIKKAYELKPDLILLDMNLPGMNGVDVIKKLKENQDLALTPIVAVTAHFLKNSKETCKQVGCNGFFTKPINTETFESEILSYI